jgi:hypothetical protein
MFGFDVINFNPPSPFDSIKFKKGLCLNMELSLVQGSMQHVNIPY